MEVHHHPHVENLSAGQAGKGIKEYFFEFIMIFLAVIHGFKTLVEINIDREQNLITLLKK